MKIDKSLYHHIQFKDVQLVELICKFNENPKEHLKKSMPIKINIASSSKIISPKLGACYLKITIGFESKEEEIFNIKVVYKGTCETMKEIDKEEFEFFLRGQSVPMLWAYARETINNVMLKMNLPPITLPTINVTELLKKMGTDNEINEGKENDGE